MSQRARTILVLLTALIVPGAPCWDAARLRRSSDHGSLMLSSFQIGLSDVPVIIRTATDLEVLELSLIENLQRSDLNAIEEAQGYARLRDEFGMKQEEVAQKVGRSRAAVANTMRLLDLHPQLQTWVAQDLLSVGHAKVLLGVKAPEEQLRLAETILRRNSSVRQTERLVTRFVGGWKKGRGAGKVVVSSAAIGDSGVCAVGKQRLHHLGAAEDDGVMQRGVSLEVDGPGIGASVEQIAYDVLAAAPGGGGHMEHREKAAARVRIRVIDALKEKAGHRDLAGGCGLDERRAIRRVGVRAMIQEEFNHLVISPRGQ